MSDHEPEREDQPDDERTGSIFPSDGRRGDSSANDDSCSEPVDETPLPESTRSDVSTDDPSRRGNPSTPSTESTLASDGIATTTQSDSAMSSETDADATVSSTGEAADIGPTLDAESEQTPPPEASAGRDDSPPVETGAQSTDKPGIQATPRQRSETQREQEDALPDPEEHRAESTPEPDDATPSLIDKVGAYFGDDQPQYETYQLGPEDVATVQNTLADRLPTGDRLLLKMKPPRDHEGLGGFTGVIQKLHDLKINWFRNVSPSFSWEIWADSGSISFYLAAPDTYAQSILDRVRTVVPNTTGGVVEATADDTTPLFPAIADGDYVAGTTFRLNRPFFYPIRTYLSEEKDPLVEDPYRGLLNDMTPSIDTAPDGTTLTPGDVQTIVQVVLEPARKWYTDGLYGVDVDTIEARKRKSSDRFKSIVPGLYGRLIEDMPATESDKKSASLIGGVRGKNGFNIQIRALAISPYEELARRRIRRIGLGVEDYYNSYTEQHLRPEGVDQERLPAFLEAAAARRNTLSWVDRLKFGNKTLQAIPAVEGLAHLPNDDINIPAVEWATQPVGAGVPAEATQAKERIAERSDDNRDDADRTDSV